MRNLALLFFATFCVPSVQGQKLPAIKMEAVVLDADAFAGDDKFGFYYTIKDNVFYKIKEGKSLEYKNLSLGKISRVDLQNPLKIVLFYESFNTAVTLDNQLNETQKINFSESTPPIVVMATGMASQNRLWIYDSLAQRIGLWDYLKNTFSFITPPLQGNLKYYTSDFNYFQWIDDKYNWYACDNFGKISMIGKVPEFDSVSITDNRMLVFSEDKCLYLLDLKSNKKYTIENIDKSFESFFIKDQILSIFTNHGITNYKITIP
jgi:hypothetical protein